MPKEASIHGGGCGLFFLQAMGTKKAMEMGVHDRKPTQ